MKYHWLFLSVCQLFCLLVGGFAFWKKSVSVSGLAALLIISSMFTWLDQVGLLLVLFYMFASSSLLTIISHRIQKIPDVVETKSGPRDYLQAVANLGPSVLIMLIYNFTESSYVLAAFLASISAANSDSWASEIGGLSKQQPFLITNFKSVPKGMSGGVTWLGLAGGLGGSAFIALAGVVTWKLFEIQGQFVPLALSALVAGLAGCVLDSYIGAWCQGLYKGLATDHLTEKPNSHTALIKGKAWINNDTVNLMTAIAGAFLGIGLYWMMASW